MAAIKEARETAEPTAGATTAAESSGTKPMTRVSQRQQTDCGIACVAIVAGCNYETAYEALGPWTGRRHFGTETVDLKRALKKLGVRTGFRTIPLGAKRVEDLGCDAVLLVNLRRDGGAHWVVWDNRQRKVLDPSEPPHKRLRFCSYLPLYRDVGTPQR